MFLACPTSSVGGGAQEMANFPDIAAVTAGVTLPIRGVFLLPAAGGRPACAPSTVTGLHMTKGSSVSAIIRKAHAEQPIIGQFTTRKPYNYTTRVDATGGGGPGPHPAREPV